MASAAAARRSAPGPHAGSAVIKRPNDARQRTSKIPKEVQFPILVLLSVALSNLLPELASQASLPAHGKTRALLRTETGAETGGALFLWKVFVLAVQWYGDYDGMDILALTVLSRGPSLYLLNAFYDVSLLEVGVSLGFDALADCLPFLMLRQLSPAHKLQASPDLPNADIVSDLWIQTIIPVVGATVYSVTLYGSFVTFLRTSLVTHFEGLHSIVAAYPQNFVGLLPASIPFGIAAKIFIFTPASATKPGSTQKKFDPATATLSETFLHNVWNFSDRTKVVIKRTFVAMVVTGGKSLVETFVAINGVELGGATAYSATWMAATALTGIVLGYASPN